MFAARRHYVFYVSAGYYPPEALTTQAVRMWLCVCEFVFTSIIPWMHGQISMKLITIITRSVRH